MAYSPILLFLLLLPLLNHAYESNESCPDRIPYHCDDYSGNFVEFPYTNSALPDCGLCVLECGDHTKTTFECGQQQLSYKTKQIFPHNSTLVLVYPGLHVLTSNVCNVHQNDSIIINIQTPPLTSFTILNLIVFLRCSIEHGGSDVLGNHLTRCGDDTVYGPYPAGEYNTQIPSDCTATTLPNSTDDSFSVMYKIPDQCARCALGMSECHDSTTGKLLCPPAKQGNKIVVLILTSIGTVVIVSVILFLASRALKDRFSFDNKKIETILESYGSLAPKRYTYNEVQRMTNSFKEKLGEGGFGGVYKGKLLDGRLVAIKMLKQAKGNGEDFTNELGSISSTNHVNVVTLLGFCCAGRKRALVYEFMANGSLEKFINGEIHCGQLLQLHTLFEVSLGVARGLEYLHQGCKTRILHFDIKPHNILLDEDFCPKISDFGLAKVSQQNKKSKVTMSGVRGTIGYIAPEMICRHFGDVSYKADVYSYGMMVLEIIGSRRRQVAGTGGSREIIFPQWIYEQLENGDEQNLNDEEKILKRKMIIVSLWCIQTVPSCRPSMSSVLKMLQGSVELLQIPPMPSLSSPPRPQFDPSGSSILTLQTESLETSC